MTRQLQHEDYTVGWVCALPVELAAAAEMLDEEHTDLDRKSNDDNLYALGSTGGHNVVIVCLPAGRIGNNPAASVATQMRATFKEIRFGLMVGIGGGVPGEKDIRLGDVVVSRPDSTFGGVVQYDFGKTNPNGLERIGSLNSPPQLLLSAVAKVQANKMRGRSKVPDYIAQLDGLRKFRRSATGPDVLFQSSYNHEGGQTCENCSEERQEVRQPRNGEEIVVHYGTIASGNQVIKSAADRDRLSSELGGVLCFEMEAAGLMNSFPCLVVRGICDYADSHKNKRWQPYAAVTAAAYAKEVLLAIPPSKVKAERKIGEVFSGLQVVTEEHRDIAQKQLAIQQDAVRQQLSHQQMRCLQLFRLTKTLEDATYEWYKGRIEERIDGTCKWLLEHSNFFEWFKRDSGPLLVSADPGCGKSVLVKYLIDHVLPPADTIYFFFKDQDQNTVSQAVCALLHQLFSQKPFLIQHAMKEFERNGEGLINSTDSLWTILDNSITDPQAGLVVIVLDALDECAEKELENLVKNVERQLHCLPKGVKLKYLLTSRPYSHIVSSFHDLETYFPFIRIPGEDESDVISREINCVIKHRVQQLGSKMGLTDSIKNTLQDSLLKIQHRTYLWLYLALDHLRNEGFKRTKKGIEEIVETIPKSVNEAYEQILIKSKNRPMVRKTLAIIMAANRPLTVSEMNVAVNMNEQVHQYADLDLEEDEEFKGRLRSWCGLFVSIHHDRVYFLHQTAREFLLADPKSCTTIDKIQWHQSITFQDAHAILLESCIRSLVSFDTQFSHTGILYHEVRHIGQRDFLQYSSQFWTRHFREAGITNDDSALIELVLTALSNALRYEENTEDSIEFDLSSPVPNEADRMLERAIDHRLSALTKHISDNFDLQD